MPRFSWLGKLMTLLGVASLATLILSIIGEIYAGSTLLSFALPSSAGNVVTKISSACNSLALAYFCLFVGALFKRIEKERSANPKRIENFCILTCLFFAASGALQLYEYLSLLQPEYLLDPTLGFTHVMVWLGLGLDIFFRVGPFLYAAVIAVLYRQFSALLQFESEEVV